MTEVAGWGVPGFLPPAVVRRMARDDAAETRQARLDEAEREQLAEERHARAVTLAVQQAEARGEVLDTMALARGEVRGRSIPEILAAAAAAGAAADRGDEMRAWRDGHGQPEPLHVFVGEPVLAASPIKRTIASRSRRWQDWQEKRKVAEAARRAVEADRDLGLPGGAVVVRRGR
jgi:hypothetical protein